MPVVHYDPSEDSVVESSEKIRTNDATRGVNEESSLPTPIHDHADHVDDEGMNVDSSPVIDSSIPFGPGNIAEESSPSISSSSSIEQNAGRETQNRATRLLSMISQMGREALGNLDPSEVLNKIIASAWGLMPGVRVVSIFIKEGDDLVVAAAAGEAINMQGQRLPMDTPLLKSVLESGRAECFRNVFQSSDLFNHPLLSAERQSQILLVAPLKSGVGYSDQSSLISNTIGLMMAAYSGDQNVTDDDLFFLDGAASWAAIAIINARQHQEINRQLHESQAILRISQALISTLELDEVTKLIVDAAKELISGVEGAVIHRLDSSRQTLQAVAVAGEIGSRNPNAIMKVGSGIAGQVLAEGRLINVADLTIDPRGVPSSNHNLRSLLVVPVNIESELVGTISVQSSQAGMFTEADERILQTLGSEAGLAMKNARLYQQEHNQRVLSEALEQAAVTLNRDLNLELVLDNILAQVAQVVHCQNFNVMLINGQKVQVVREWDQDKEDPKHSRLVSTEVSITMPTLQKIIKSGQPLLVTDTSLSPIWDVIEGTEWIRSYVGVPLKAGELILGFLNADSDQPDFFDDVTVQVLQSFASHAAIAIQNARLVQDLQEALKQEKAMRVQLTRADRLATMGMITASVAHEINNPIQAILGCLELAQMDALQRDQQLEYLTMAKQELLRLASITKRVLNYQRSPQQNTAEPVELAAVVEDVLALAKKKLQHAKVNVATEWEPDLPVIIGSPNELKQVFLNLVLNAVDAMKNGGQLKIIGKTFSDDRHWVQVLVKDNGEGMTPEVLQRLGEPFFSTKEAGTGLGLWVSRDIISSHGGKVTVDSVAGEGTTFTVWLPF